MNVELPDGRSAATTLTTEFEADASFDAAQRFCDPMNWTNSPFWCAMEDLGVGDGVHRYRETVSFDCGNPHALELVIDLDFTSTVAPGPPRLAVTEYRLSGGHEQSDVLVNEGSLIVREISSDPPRIGLTTTKRIKFSDPASGEALAMLSCPLGYARMVEDLFWACVITT